ncbi:MAG: magnesium transporter [Flavobacteriales bacterium]|nr:magnesium transporter [Flavobacteriales bacterium]
MQFTITKELLYNLRERIAEGKDSAILQVIADAHPADIAELINELRDNEAVYLFRLLGSEIRAEVLPELDEDVQDNLLESLTSREIAEDLIENFESDDAADLLSGLSEQKQEEVISLLEDEEQASDIIDLMTYEEGTAGALMGKEIVAVNQNWSVAQAIREMRKQAEDLDNVYTIYVVDDKDVLLGTLSMKSLIFASTSMRTLIRDLFKKESVRTVDVHTPTEEVSNIMEKYNLVALPVVNESRTLLGRITIDDVVDVMKEEADKDYQLASGISEDVESSDNVWTLTRARLPWILIGMGGGLLSAQIIGVFDITEHPEMALFMPLIAATGGNVGVQSAALVVKALANQSAFDESLPRKLAKEFSVGLLNGTICSSIILLVSFLSPMHLSLGITASVALFSVILFAGFMGTWIPITLNRFGIDPALATGPFITTTNDIVGLIIYFSVGHWVMQSFV